jgi:hypothetical protein
MGDFLVSLIRTWVPVAIGYLVTVGLLPTDLSDQATAALTAVITAVYYGLARLLEKRWPVFGWLLGVPKEPSYPTS